MICPPCCARRASPEAPARACRGPSAVARASPAAPPLRRRANSSAPPPPRADPPAPPTAARTRTCGS
eukprot:396416-Pleurochrysis_carterae.AAC.1